jgi:hypothetical protein
MARSVELVAVDIGGQSHRDTVSQLLLVAEADLASVVNLRSDRRLVVKIVLAAHAKGRGSFGRRDGDTSFQLIAELLVNSARKLLPVVDRTMDDEVAGIVGEGEVILGKTGLANVKGHLVTSSNLAVSKSSGGVDDGAGGNSYVRIDSEVFVLKLRLDLSTLVTRGGQEVGIESQLESLHHLVLYIHGRIERVVGGPLLGEAQTIVHVTFILSFQASRDLAAVRTGRSGTVEFKTCVGLGLNIEFYEPEMVTLPENVAGLFSNVGIRWRCHGLSLVWFCDLL